MAVLATKVKVVAADTLVVLFKQTARQEMVSDI
jgi:hypothetical protein